MLLEKHALLDHADRCRRIAREIEHARASERLITMAQEYEARAAMFEVPETAKGSRAAGRFNRRGSKAADEEVRGDGRRRSSLKYCVDTTTGRLFLTRNRTFRVPNTTTFE